MRRGRIPTGLLAAALFVASGSARAQGGPPLVTDDPGTPGAGKWEVNVAFTMDRTSDSGQYGAPLVDVNYGWGPRLQLKLEIPLSVTSDSAGTRSGLGNPLLGVKWRFLDEETAGVAVSTYPQYGFNLLRSSSERGLADEDAHFLLPVSAVKSLGPVEVNLEAGRVFASGGEGQWIWGVALGHAFGSVEALAEAFGSTGDEAAVRQVVINLGARVPVSAGSTFLVSGGWSVSSSDGQRHAYAYVGLQLTTARKGTP